MKKRAFGLVAATAFAIAAIGAPVAGDEGGRPNENAGTIRICHFAGHQATNPDDFIARGPGGAGRCDRLGGELMRVAGSAAMGHLPHEEE